MSHPELEAPLLLAAQILVQAAQRVALERATAAAAAATARAGGRWPRDSERAPTAVKDDDGASGETDETAAVRHLLEECFPRGRFRCSVRGVSADLTVSQESHGLLVAALAALAATTGGARDKEDGGHAVAVVNPKDFPVLMSGRVHADMVAGLEANLMEVEVRLEACRRRGGGGGVCGFSFYPITLLVNH